MESTHVDPLEIVVQGLREDHMLSPEQAASVRDARLQLGVGMYWRNVVQACSHKDTSGLFPTNACAQDYEE